MTTLNTTEDLLRAARENPEFREAFRREILTEDLVTLPQQVGALTTNIENLTNSITEYKNSTDSRLDALQSATDANATGIENLVSVIAKMNGNIDEIRSSHRLEHNALHRFRGNYAIETTRNNDFTIPDMFASAFGIQRFRLRDIPKEERDDLFDDNLDAIDRLDTEGNTSTSFPTGDVISEVSQRRTLDTLYYIAVEASYTVDAEDVIRASDNAKVLRAITGHAAYSVVSGVALDPRLGDEYRRRIIYDLPQYLESEEDNLVFWFQLEDRSMEPLTPC